ncbi:MAG TPA: protein-glutamate O-methyltransferase CheR [Geothrix sp.]|nr:protein-glutamate O-methyltransferase CheR [Geothrix sp.]
MDQPRRPASPASEAAGDYSIRKEEFRAFQDLIHRESGIFLADHKLALLGGRLHARLRALGLTSYGEYFKAVQKDEAERIEMLDRISTNETHFFREPHQFEFLKTHVLPRWVEDARAGRRPRSIRVWSAACSTGEEPYSIAMLLLDQLPSAEGWSIEILGTDISTRVLQKAKDALWRIEKAEEIPTPYLKAFMLEGTGPEKGRMKAGPEIRSLVSFSRMNLNSRPYPVPGGFDIIFCRNVLIYFNTATKAGVVEELLAHLAPSGLLLLGHAESLHGLTEQARSVGPTIYAPLQSTYFSGQKLPRLR